MKPALVQLMRVSRLASAKCDVCIEDRQHAYRCAVPFASARAGREIVDCAQASMAVRDASVDEATAAAERVVSMWECSLLATHLYPHPHSQL